MEELSAHLDGHDHRCVPLGWLPVAVAGSYYPDYSIEYRPEGVWLRPYWIGAIFNGQQNEPHIRKVAEVMDALAAVGLVQQQKIRIGHVYRLTPKAIPYYSEDNSYGDNPDHLPFLCYTRIVPTKIESLVSGTGQSLEVRFSWNETAASQWANDYLREHSVILPPLSSPVMATLQKDQYGWQVQDLHTRFPMLGHVLNPRAWSS